MYFFPKFINDFLIYTRAKKRLQNIFVNASLQTLLDPDPSTNWTAIILAPLDRRNSDGNFDTKMNWAQK